MIDRRSLFAGLASCLCPLARAHAAPQRTAHVAFLSGSTALEPVAATHLRRYLVSLGWSDGGNLQLSEHYAGGNIDMARRLSVDIVATHPDVIVATGYTETRLLASATRDIPVVFLQIVDPVGVGLVESLARPGGNVTGMAAAGQLLWSKRLELIAEFRAGAGGRVAFIANPQNAAVTMRSMAEIAEKAPHHGLETTLIPVAGKDDIEAAFAGATDYDALLVQHDFVLFSYRRRVVELATTIRRPAVYENRFSPIIGGMASYGADLHENYRQAAVYVDRILRGTPPAGLPVVQPNRVEFVLNLTTVGRLGLTVPPAVLARADEVLE